MYCPECGKSIPDESKFCLHCGKPIGLQQSELLKSKFSDEPPTFIKHLEFCFHGPTTKSWGFFTGSITLRGFAIAFSLADKSDKLTRADGEVGLVLTHPLHPLKKKRFNYQVKKEDFCEVSISYISPPGELTFLGCWIKHKIPEMATDGGEWETEIWFKTVDGQKLYAKG